LTDYGTLVLAELAVAPERLTSASELANATGIGLATVSKILKSLAKNDLVQSVRGAHGGYRLARPPADISAADIIDALEGPVSITECSTEDKQCSLEAVCHVGNAWQRINVAIRRALADVTLSDLQVAHAPVPRFEFAGTPVSVERKG